VIFATYFIDHRVYLDGQLEAAADLLVGLADLGADKRHGSQPEPHEFGLCGFHASFLFPSVSSAGSHPGQYPSRRAE
jgi:hypothetical protein